jgi:hypothetical protein
MERNALAPRGGGRRKVVALSAAVVLSFAIAIPMLASGAAGTAPSSDINDYSLYAVQTLQLKGGGVAGRSIIDGNIGAGTKHWKLGYSIPTTGPVDEYTTSTNWLAKTPDNRFLQPAATGAAHLTLCQGSGDNGRLTLINSLDPASKPYIVAPSLNVDFEYSTCGITNAYTLGNLDISPYAIVHSNFTPPDIAIPAIPAVNGCFAAKTLTGTNPAPGTYFGYSVPKASTLTLAAGTYNFCGDLKVLNNAKVITDPLTKINVTGLLSIDVGSGGKFGNCGTTVNVNGSVNFGSNSTITGTIVAPKADVALGNGTNITGHVWAFAMHSDWGVNVSQCKPPVTTTTTSTTVAPPTTVTTTTTITTTTTTVPIATTTTTVPIATTTTTRPATTTTTTRPTTTTTGGGNVTTTTLGDT